MSEYRRFTSPHVHHEKWLKAQFKWQLYIQIMHKNNIHAWSYCKQSDIILKRYIFNTRLGKINHFSTATKNLKLAVKKNLSFDKVQIWWKNILLIDTVNTHSLNMCINSKVCACYWRNVSKVINTYSECRKTIMLYVVKHSTVKITGIQVRTVCMYLPEEWMKTTQKDMSHKQQLGIN